MRSQRLADAVQQRVFGSPKGSPGARACYDQLRACYVGNQARPQLRTTAYSLTSYELDVPGIALFLSSIEHPALGASASW
jgi:hypothetical protein